jgi:hypothetical protein
MNNPPRTRCAAPGCSRPPHHPLLSAHCTKHGAALYRYGAVNGRAIRPSELKPYAEPVARTLARYGNSKGVQGALQLTAELLNYRSHRDYSWELELQSQMTRLRDGGVTPREFLTRVCVTWALQADRQRFDGERELAFGLAREVLKLRTRTGTWRPGGILLYRFGCLIRDELGTFPAGVWMKASQDADARAQARKSFAAGWRLDGEA